MCIRDRYGPGLQLAAVAAFRKLFPAFGGVTVHGEIRNGKARMFQTGTEAMTPFFRDHRADD